MRKFFAIASKNLRIFYRGDWTFYSYRKKCKIDLKSHVSPKETFGKSRNENLQSFQQNFSTHTISKDCLI